MTEAVTEALTEAVTDAPTEVTSAALLAQAGLTYRQLEHWTRRGYLRPTAAAPGTGNPRSFPAEEVSVARVLRTLVAAGLTHERASVIAREHAIPSLSSFTMRLGEGITLVVHLPPVTE